MKIEWFKEFFDLYFNMEIDDAYKHKHRNIPRKLYKFQPYEENRLDTVLNNKLWFTLPKDMNDPFDSRGMFWNTKEMEVFLKAKIPEEKISEFESTDSIINGAISSLSDNIKITCFSEEIFSMPMWSHYADNHKGFCMEYDFSSLSWDNDLTQNLFPVWYESYRYNITNLLKETFNEIYNPKIKSKIKLLYFLMSIKHKSWSYEKEWRIIKPRSPLEEIFKGGLEECETKPVAIYLGVNFDKDKVSELKNKITNTNADITIYALKTINSEFFDMNLEKV